MPSQAVKEKLAADVGLWRNEGMIGPETYATLQSRYDVPGFGVVIFIKYLGITGGFFAGLGLLTLFTAISSQKIVPFLSGGIAAGFFAVGLRLWQDPLGRYIHSSKIVMALGGLSWVVSVASLPLLSKETQGYLVFAAGLLSIPALGYIAYRNRNIILLIITLVFGFHWFGSGAWMMGRSTYAFSIQDPKLMIPVSLLVIAVGVYHERILLWQNHRFYQAWESLGLVYLNMSLLILSIFPRSEALAYIALLSLAAVGQILLGAWLKNRILVGFGVVAMAVNLFTRYFERFWDHLDAGVFFLIGGAVLLAIAVALEAAIRTLRKRGTA